VKSRRVAFAVALVGALALVGAVVFAACGSESTSGRSERSTPSSTTPETTAPVTTPTTVAPLTVPVPPLPPAGPTTAPPPPITVPPRTSRTTPPTVTAAPAPGSTTTPSNKTKPDAVVRKTVVYTPPGGPKHKGDLVLPRQHADTIIVLAHPDDQAGSRKQMRGWANFYAQNGYPSLAIDYSVTGPPGTYPKPQTDVKAAVQYLRGRAGALGVEPDHIVVQGFDAGAALGAQAEVAPDDPFFDGPRHYANQSDKPAAFIGFYGLYDGTQKDPTIYYGGPPDSSDAKVQERYAQANSIAHAADAAGPALLVQGEADSQEFVESATQFRAALQSAGKDVTLTLVPGAGSTFDQDTSGALTTAGKEAAKQVLDWLAARFPPS